MSELIRTDTVLGKQQVIAGSSDKDFVIQTKGKVKVQQGNRFIDLIKDGTIKFPDVINIVSSRDKIGTANGFYFVTDEGALYAVINKNLFSLNGGNISSNTNNGDIIKRLEDLEDTLLINLRDGDLLAYQGGYWVNSLLNIRDLENLILSNTDKLREELKNQSAYTQRVWQDTQETFAMMYDPEGNFFTEKITPLAIQTAQLIVGTNSQQFGLENIKFAPNYLGDANRFAAFVIDPNRPGILIHNTIGLGDDTSVVGNTWQILQNTELSLTTPDFDQQDLDPTKPYYLYARCDKYSNSGNLLLSTEPILLEEETNYYHFWIGVLNTPRASILESDSGIPSETANNSLVRSFQTMYGFTEITGNQITTGVIKDQTGFCYWDMINGNMRIGDPGGSYISFDSDTKTLIIKGYITQTDPNNPELSYKGMWESGITYDKNSIVLHNGNLYKCLLSNSGNEPPNDTYWEVMIPGVGYELIYILTDSENTPDTPTGDNPSGWSKYALETTADKKYLWISDRIKDSNGEWGTWSVPKLFSRYVSSNFSVDLDNEMDSVACNSDMTVYSNQTITTTISAFVGSFGATITEATAGTIGTVSPSIIKSGNTATITYSFTTANTISKVNEVTITVKASLDGVTYTGSRKFTVNGVTGGKDAIIYSLVPSASTIKRTSSNSNTPEYISCSRIKTIAGTTSSTTDGTMSYIIDSGDEYTYTGSSIATSTITSQIKFIYKVNNTVCDIETVPVLLDATNAFKSIVFKRDTNQPSTPEGGSYTSPVPNGWSDGIPSGDTKLWMSSRIFSQNGLSPQTSGWTTPSAVTSTSNLKIVFSPSTNTSAPSIGTAPYYNSNWSPTGDANSVWMATATCIDGVWGSWQISKIKGEQGVPGNSGPALVFRGAYNANNTYYASDSRADVVKTSDGTYYMTNYKDYSGSWTGIKFGLGTDHWIKMNSFANVATDILLANIANIGGFNFNNVRMWSGGTNTNIYLNGNAGTSSSDLVFGVGSGLITKVPNSVDNAGTFNIDNAKFAVYGNGSIKATAGTIGGFTISDTALTSTNITISNNSIANSDLIINGGTLAIGGDNSGSSWSNNVNYYIRLGGISTAAGTGPSNATLMLKNIRNSQEPYSSNGSCLALKCGTPASYNQSYAQNWIYATNQSGQSHFYIGLLDFNQGYSRTYIKAHNMVYKSQLVNNKLATGGTWHNLVYHDDTGYIAWDF